MNNREIIFVPPLWCGIIYKNIFWSFADVLNKKQNQTISVSTPKKWDRKDSLFRNPQDPGATDLVLIEPEKLKSVDGGLNRFFILTFLPTLDDVARIKHTKNTLGAKGVPASQIILVLFEDEVDQKIPIKIIKDTLGPLGFIVPVSSHFKTKRFIQSLCDLLDIRFKNQNLNEKNISFDPKEVEEKITKSLWNQIETLGQVEKEIDQALAAYVWKGKPINQTVLSSMKQNIKDALIGLGPLQACFRDPHVSEIMVNGSSQVYVERQGQVQVLKNLDLKQNQLNLIIERIVSQAGKRVDHASPLCDVRLKDGSRANVVLPPISLQGPVLTIRRFKRNLLSFEDLIQTGSITIEKVKFLKDAVQQRKNILISGNSGSGKTTFLNLLSKEINPEERIMTLEDTAELKLVQPHVVRFETRVNNAEGQGKVDMKDLVINALRMRPDRIVVGECRGHEVIPMLQAMNTGHDGSMTTLHANSAQDTIQRLESMVLVGAPSWPIDVVRQQIVSALDLVVYLKRVGTKRTCEDIHEIQFQNGFIKTQSIFKKG